MSQRNMLITKSLMYSCVVLFLSAITVSMFAMEKPESFSKRFAPKKITVDTQDKRKNAAIKNQNKADQVLAQRAQEIAQSDKTYLTVEKVSNKKAFYPDKDSQNINFAAVIPTKKNVKPSTNYVGTPMPEKHIRNVVSSYTNPKNVTSSMSYVGTPMPPKNITKFASSHTNPMQLANRLNYYMENKDTEQLSQIMNNPVYAKQIKAFEPYHALENVENIENFNRNMLGAQQWIAQNEQVKKAQKTKNNNNNNS